MAPGRKYWNNNASHSTWTDADKAAFDNKDFYPTSGSGYNNQKWATERNVKDEYEGYDFPIIRYAEVLLNYAEAVFERNADAEGNIMDASKVDAALVYLNEVRQRVNPNMPGLTTSFATTHNLKMREEIRRERTVELFNEGFRIDDLKRWKTAENEMPQTMLGIKWKGTEYESWNTTFSLNDEGCVVVETGRQWADKNYLYPLPSDQLQLNPTLGQNPGWGE